VLEITSKQPHVKLGVASTHGRSCRIDGVRSPVSRNVGETKRGEAHLSALPHI